ncbi:hypothetical protein [Streptomyces sp. NPDC018352]|uniref:hypothetical protein n=1 Tax=Streptomyces sp. NPDC018352 TaxID=3157194 RepID=UPI00340EC23A
MPSTKSEANSLISHESDEHLARKERVAKDSEDHGFQAVIESQTADGHARLDVRINGATDFGSSG